MRKLLCAALVTAATLVVAGANAATPAGGTVSGGSTTANWTGGPFLTSNPNPAGLCLDGDPACDSYSLTIQPPGGGFNVQIGITPSSAGDDYDLFVENAAGTRVASSASDGGTESVILTNPAAGTYTVRVLAWAVLPGGTYTGRATLTPVAGGGGGTNDPNSVKWPYDPDAAQASVEVPLRVVMVGFQPGELNETALVGEVPDTQRPGVLIPRGTDSSGDAFPLFGAETLVNHGRNYYNDSKPFLVPYEYRWKRQVTYALGRVRERPLRRDEGELDDGRVREVRQPAVPRELQRDARHSPRRALNQVTPNAPVRFVDGEKTEDWIAANAPTHARLRLRRPRQGPGQEPRLHRLRAQHLGLARARRRTCSPSASTTSSRSTAPTPTRTTSTGSTGLASGAAATAS